MQSWDHRLSTTRVEKRHDFERPFRSLRSCRTSPIFLSFTACSQDSLCSAFLVLVGLLWGPGGGKMVITEWWATVWIITVDPNNEVGYR